MSRATSVASLCAALLASALPAAAEPRETPLKNQRAILSYEVEVTGKRGGQRVRDRIVVRLPVVAKESAPLNPYADGFTESQQSMMDEMSAAATSTGGGDGTADMLEANRLVEAMMAACLGNEASSGCAAARSRYQAAEQKMADQNARGAAAMAQVRVRDDDQHRFLIFMAGSEGTIETSYDHDGRKGGVRVQGPIGPEGELATYGDMFVLDRRDGSLGLSMLTAGVEKGELVGDVEHLAGHPEIKRLELPWSPTVVLPMQPTAGADQAYAGAKTLRAGELTWTFHWRLEMQ